MNFIKHKETGHFPAYGGYGLCPLTMAAELDEFPDQKQQNEQAHPGDGPVL